MNIWKRNNRALAIIPSCVVARSRSARSVRASSASNGASLTIVSFYPIDKPSAATYREASIEALPPRYSPDPNGRGY
jgi:hypothetical protein